MQPLQESEIDARLASLAPGWHREDGAIVCERECANFAAAITLINRIAVLAEQDNHHPDLCVHSYKQLRITLSTHSAGGVTERDFALAAQIDAL